MSEKSYKEQQIEALEELYRYNKKLIPATEGILKELTEEPQEDTKKFLDTIIKGINWEIQVLNCTLDIINEKEEIISKQNINIGIQELNSSLQEENEFKIADALEVYILPFLRTLDARAAIVTKNVQ